MTRTEWLTATEPDRMLDFLRARASDRKFLLFACGCCQIARDPAREFRATVPILERAAENALRARDRSRAVAGLVARPGRRIAAAAAAAAAQRAERHKLEAQHVAVALRTVEWCARLGTGTPVDPATHPGQCAVLRDVVGDPFDPVAMHPGWVTGTVAGLAAAIDHDRAYDRMPILADALEDAGCDAGAVLAHCRSGEHHFYGCWVIDALLGRS